MRFFDPACGSGNFLTETYVSIRRLENLVLLELNQGQISFADESISPIRVSIAQFYGIEINDFAVTVAKTALWIAESQMMQETETVVKMNLDFLPLKTNTNIIEGNALRMNWEEVCPKFDHLYIMGNPPFLGFTYMNKSQKSDMASLFPGTKNLDYVCGWYKKASDYIKDSTIECGFVSTNSITQGETVASLWKHINIKINFAYRTFIWDSEANQKAHVHCVIIGFADFNRNEKMLFENDTCQKVNNINAYLVNAPNIIVASRNKPLCDISPMIIGNKPADGGHLIIEEDDYYTFIEKDKNSLQFIKPLLGAVEFLHNKKRWCLWLVGASPSDIQKCPLVMDRIQKCKESRLSSKAEGIRKFAKTPALFAQVTQPVGADFILIPRVSSEKRDYIPMSFLDGNTIVTDAVQIVPNASIYEFGIITSNVHMAWMRTVCGRMKSDYRYSKDVVYNNFPWPEPTDEQKAKIEQTAQQILDVRAKYPDCSLADLYDDLVMPSDLREAHRANDRAVMQAYGFPIKMTESECVAEFMKMYENLTK